MRSMCVCLQVYSDGYVSLSKDTITDFTELPTDADILAPFFAAQDVKCDLDGYISYEVGF